MVTPITPHIGFWINDIHIRIVDAFRKYMCVHTELRWYEQKNTQATTRKSAPWLYTTCDYKIQRLYIYIYISAHDRYISILFRWQAVRLLACVREGNLMVARVGSSTQFHVSTPKNACFPLRWLCWSWCASIEGHTTCWRTQGSLWCGA